MRIVWWGGAYPQGIGNHYMTVAHLNGADKQPYILISQGIYAQGAVWAYQYNAGEWELVWTYQSQNSLGTSSHAL